MFNGCSSLTELDLSSFNMSKVTADNNIKSMFNGCTHLTKIYANTTFDYSSKTFEMFSNCSALKGENGTKYEDMPSNNRKQAKYACIDQGTTKPGYFTSKQ